MYIPPHFALHRPEDLQRVLREHPLGMLVTHTEAGLDADPIPFEFDPAAGPMGTLRGHVARANPVWQRAAGRPVMVLFRGAESFVSPSWYPSKHAEHRQVPTWVYEVVHLHGPLVVHDDERHVRGVVARLTRHHEAGEPRPWKMSDSAPEFIDGMLRSIVGIEIPVERWEGKSKLSQNKAPADRLGAAGVLETRGRTELAERMRSTLEPRADGSGSA